MAKKSLFVTYILWFFGGFFGWHHFYLGRDYQGLIWLMFGGGYFGIGLIRDLWKIPEYVQDANEDYHYMEKLARKMQKHSKPPFKLFRNIGQFIVADLLGHLAVLAVPQELVPDPYYYYIAASVAPIAVAVGVYLVGNIGREEGEFRDALLGAYLTLPVTFVMETPITLVSFASCSYFNIYSKRWRRTPPPNKSVLRRIAVVSFFMIVYLSLFSSMLYFNCSITTQDEETVKCRDAVKHFFTSPIWKEFVIVMRELWKSLQEHGWREIWQQLIDAMDPTGEANALKVLGLNETATQQEITLRYRRLSRTWHPDKHKDPEQKQIAQDKFIEIQQAYEILSKIKAKRVAQNVRNERFVNNR